MRAISSAFPAVDFTRFHRDEIPRLLAAGNGRLAAGAARSLDPLAFRVGDGPAFTYLLRDGSVDVLVGDTEAQTVAVLTARQWSDLVNQIRSVPNLVYSGELHVERGELGHVMAWELALQALIHGRPTFTPDAALPRDDNGVPLDLRRIFTTESDDRELADFLRRAGFVHVRSVLDETELGKLRKAADAVTEAARPGDKRSWWAHDGDGQRLLCRVTYANESSEPIARLSEHPDLMRLGGLLGPESVDTPDRMDGHSLIIKHPGAVDGLSDLPWHIDCGMGGHSFMCPIVQLSVFLEAADADSGSLSIIPGSHRFATPMPTAAEERSFGAVDIEAAPGDVLVHLGDTMHAAKAPRGAGPYRRSIVMSFFQRRLLEIVDAGEAYNDVLLDDPDGHVRHI